MWQKLLISVLSVLIGGGITLVGKPYVDAKLEERKVPVLVKEIYRPDVSGLSQELQRRVTVLPLKYTLEHKVGGSARNVTIFMNGGSAIAPSEIRFARGEAYQCTQLDPSSIRIDVPIVRPGGVVTFEILAELSNKIEFRELIEVGKVLSTAAYKAQEQKPEFLIMGGISLVVLIWIAFMVTVILVTIRVWASWRNMEVDAQEATGNIRKPLIKLIIVISLYNIVRGSLGPLGGFLPLPYFSFSTFFYAFCLYLLITRYKLIEEVLKKVAVGNVQETNAPDGAGQDHE